MSSRRRGARSSSIRVCVHIHDDSVGPVFAAGLVDVVAPDADLGGGLRCEPTVGHTPGHVSLWLEFEGETALLTGDVLHHPVQCAVPSLAFVSDDDAELGRDTRRGLLAMAAGTEALVFGTYFATSPAGHVVRHGDSWRFEPIPGTR
jgi:glyoxylase-like metal-dependent hydrolase (beta-lactamase superfamily II)